MEGCSAGTYAGSPVPPPRPSFQLGREVPGCSGPIWTPAGPHVLWCHCQILRPPAKLIVVCSCCSLALGGTEHPSCLALALSGLLACVGPCFLAQLGGWVRGGVPPAVSMPCLGSEHAGGHAVHLKVCCLPLGCPGIQLAADHTNCHLSK